MTDFCAGTLPIDVHTLEKTVDGSHELFHLHKRDADLAHWPKYRPLPMDCTISSNHSCTCVSRKKGGNLPNSSEFLRVATTDVGGSQQIGQKTRNFPTREFSWAISRSRTYHNFWNSPSGRHLFKRMSHWVLQKWQRQKPPTSGWQNTSNLRMAQRPKADLGNLGDVNHDSGRRFQPECFTISITKNCVRVCESIMMHPLIHGISLAQPQEWSNGSHHPRSNLPSYWESRTHHVCLVHWLSSGKFDLAMEKMTNEFYISIIYPSNTQPNTTNNVSSQYQSIHHCIPYQLLNIYMCVKGLWERSHVQPSQ